MIKFKAESIKSPRWARADQSAISCIVKFEHLLDEHEFIATPRDCEEHGREIFRRCINGEFGEIKPFIPIEAQPSFIISSELPEPYQNLPLFYEVNNENAKQSFKSLVISWGAMIDESLTELLNKFADKHLNVKVNLNTFDDKIKSAYKYNLITDKEKIRLDCIRYIRNEVAHKWQITLENEKLFNNLRKLYDLDHADYYKFIEDLDFLLRSIYTGSCASLMMTLKERLRMMMDS